MNEFLKSKNVIIIKKGKKYGLYIKITIYKE